MLMLYRCRDTAAMLMDVIVRLGSRRSTETLLGRSLPTKPTILPNELAVAKVLLLMPLDSNAITNITSRRLLMLMGGLDKS